MDELYEAAQKILREYQAANGVNGHSWEPVDLKALLGEEFDLDWLVEGFWPAGKHMHLFAAHKSGKSLLSLHLAVQIALGMDPFTGQPTAPHVVTYIDKEMTRQDLQERLLDMGLSKIIMDDLLTGRLLYYLYPDVGYLDTPEGGAKLMHLVESNGSDVVIIDTLSRVVKGEENSNDTYKNFYNCTGSLLKSNGVAMLRLDHEGHQQGHSRGASSKGDDVDLVYHLKPVETGLALEMKASRVSYVRKQFALDQTAEPLGFSLAGGFKWPAGTVDRVKELEAIGCPEGLSQRKTQQWLRDNGHSVGKTEILAAALKYRNQQVEMPGL